MLRIVFITHICTHRKEVDLESAPTMPQCCTGHSTSQVQEFFACQQCFDGWQQTVCTRVHDYDIA